MIRRLLTLAALLCFSCMPARAAYLVRVRMVSPSFGWAIGAVSSHFVVYRTTDGGRQWASVSPPGFTSRAASGVDVATDGSSIGTAFLGQRRAWVALVDGTRPRLTVFVFLTTDSGRRWAQSRFLVSAVGEGVFLQFLDPADGFILGISDPAAGQMGKEVYRTVDGGRTWRKGGNPDQGRYSFYPTGMTFRSPKEGWVTATYHGEPDTPFLHTKDGGRTWHQQQLPIPSLYQGGYANTDPPQFFGREEGIMLVDLVNHTSRRGDVGEQAVFVSHDGGARWRFTGTLPFTETEDEGASLNFLGAQRGWAADTHRHLFVTQNGGRTWRRIAQHFGPPSPTGEEAWEWTQLDFISPRSGWALFRRRTAKTFFNDLYRTRDGGHHWDHIQTGSTPNALYAITPEIGKHT